MRIDFAKVQNANASGEVAFELGSTSVKEKQLRRSTFGSLLVHSVVFSRPGLIEQQLTVCRLLLIVIPKSKSSAT